MVNKKGTKRKTRWRTLSVTDGGPTSDSGAETILLENTGTNTTYHHQNHHEGNLLISIYMMYMSCSFLF